MAIKVQHLVQLAPVIHIILYAFVHKEVYHLQPEFVIALDLVHIKLQHIPAADTEAGGIEVERRFFLARNTDTDIHRVLRADGFFIVVKLVLIVNDRYHILETLVDEFGNTARIGAGLKTVTDDVGFLGYFTAFIQRAHNIQVIRK